MELITGADGGFVGQVLLKFFRDKEILESFLDGMFWCNSPEFYRLSYEAGVGDFNESCCYSYREERDKEAPKITIDGVALDGLIGLTQHSNKEKDRWLHSWFILNTPNSDEDCIKAVQTINRMREEFGRYYAVLQVNNIQPLINRLTEASKVKIDAIPVTYSDDMLEWSCTCKSSNYAYQEEFRFLVDYCSSNELEPKKIDVKEGFRDIVDSCIPLTIVDKATGEYLFKLNVDVCTSSLMND
tara:strand:+ start:396 stop:1121 length:726 start_codon:yes stop_codon:yes gene_type:complete